jgi:DNA-binding PadR family transcriptional regulator
MICGIEEERLYRVLDKLEKDSLVAEKAGIYKIKE